MIINVHLSEKYAEQLLQRHFNDAVDEGKVLQFQSRRQLFDHLDGMHNREIHICIPIYEPELRRQSGFVYDVFNSFNHIQPLLQGKINLIADHRFHAVKIMNLPLIMAGKSML